MTNTTTKKSDVTFISAYSPKLKVETLFTGEGRTKQAHKAECDINNILARFKRTGVIDFHQKNEPRYGDCTALEFQSAQLLIANAKGMFAAMPAHLRARFDNDPAKFLAFVDDPRNRNEMEDLGLMKPKGEETAAPAAVPQPEANPTAAPATPPAPAPKTA